MKLKNLEGEEDHKQSKQGSVSSIQALERTFTKKHWRILLPVSTYQGTGLDQIIGLDRFTLEMTSCLTCNPLAWR